METEPSSPSLLQVAFSCLLFLFSSVYTPVQASADAALEEQVNRVIELTEEVVKERLELLDQSLLEHRFDDAVRRLIAAHLRYPAQTARNLGRAIAYFPIFEAELAAAGLPESLKYLPVIESALRPYAMSRVGAEGLWQFMPETAPEYGLRVDDYVDERLDTYAATKGAIRYLQSAYDYLGDWSLAIAAYNAGKGRVRRAQRRSGGTNFWRVKRYLPRETRKYVPAFIAAIYLTEFFAAHEISPNFPNLDEQLLERIVVTEPLSFYRIAQVTALPISLIEELNPAYLKGYLPAYPGGHNLMLPQRVVPALRTYLEHYGEAEDEPVLPWAPIFNLEEGSNHDHDYRQYLSVVQRGDSLQTIAERTHFSASQLAIWNQLSPLDSLVEGQVLRFYRPISYRYLPQRSEVNTFGPLATQTTPITSLNQPYRGLPDNVRPRLSLRLTERQSVQDILERYPQVDALAFLQLNNWTEKRLLPGGKTIILPL